MKENKNLIAVYGTLRKGQGNHKLIKDSKYLGSFESKPIFNMYSVNDAFPALRLGGITSVLFEVYEVDFNTLKKVDGLEGYVKDGKNNLYDRKCMYTPYGEAYFYTYEAIPTGLKKITSGNWVEYLELQPVSQLMAEA